jgi:hypothetical protein
VTRSKRDYFCHMNLFSDLARYSFRKALLLQSLLLMVAVGNAQLLYQTVYGQINDAESHQPVAGASVICESCKPVLGTSSDTLGFYKIRIPVGRQSLRVTHVAYQTAEVKDMMVTTGKSVVQNFELHELVIQTGDVSVNGIRNRWINPMASVSVRSLRSQDAVRYAGGFFDPSRMAANFAGVSSGNSDEDNEIIIRGNSPRGILWRIEGIEIPNPNHFAAGQGSTSGAYTAIPTDVLSNFDFFTGSFPAEFGNALSGVMDLNLRNGNSQEKEYTVLLSVIGTELSAEGPFGKNTGSSYLACFRYGDFSYLKYLKLYDEEEVGIIPNTRDWAFKTVFNTSKAGTFSFFTLGGKSEIGDIASSDPGDTGNVTDKDEYKENRSMVIAGLKHLINLKNERSYIRSTLAYTGELSSDQDDVLDSTGNRTVTWQDRYRYSAIRFASLLNYKINPRHSLRSGTSFNYIFGDLFAKNLTGELKYDTLIDSRDKGWYGGVWMQWKYKSPGMLETNTGIHIFSSGISREILAEPRFGLVLQLSEQNSFTLGTGFHSRLDPLSIYNYRIRIDKNTRETANKKLKTTKAFHITTGFNQFFSRALHLTVEGYFQYLYDVPIRESATGQFSILNQSDGLPDVIMANKGKGKNTGIELTLEKPFSNNYYVLATASLFDSKYKAPDGYWYNTFYNTNYVFNLQSGKEFTVGRNKQNVLGIRLRGNYRGGFRYTPVNLISSLKNKRVIYQTWNSYGERLPDFKRIDLGLSYRINKNRYALSFLCDIQNVTDRRNVLRRRFSYQNKSVIPLNSKSVGMVPIVSVRGEF